jgi:hypothetical protein
MRSTHESAINPARPQASLTHILVESNSTSLSWDEPDCCSRV